VASDNVDACDTALVLGLLLGDQSFIVCMYVCAVRAKEAVGVSYFFTSLRETSRGNNLCLGLYLGHWQAVDSGFFCPGLQKPQQPCHVLVVPSTSCDRRYLHIQRLHEATPHWAAAPPQRVASPPMLPNVRFQIEHMAESTHTSR
jgi:hypothetical protein